MSEESKQPRKKLSKADKSFLALLIIGGLSMATSHNIIYNLAYRYARDSRLEAERGATEQANKVADNAFQYGLYAALVGFGGSIRIKRK